MTYEITFFVCLWICVVLNLFAYGRKHVVRMLAPFLFIISVYFISMLSVWASQGFPTLFDKNELIVVALGPNAALWWLCALIAEALCIIVLVINPKPPIR